MCLTIKMVEVGVVRRGLDKIQRSESVQKFYLHSVYLHKAEVNTSSVEPYIVFVTYLGTSYTQQSYKVSDSFPFKWINKKWREGFYVTSMATAGSRWGVVMSRNAGFSDQVCNISFPSGFCYVK